MGSIVKIVGEEVGACDGTNATLRNSDSSYPVFFHIVCVVDAPKTKKECEPLVCIIPHASENSFSHPTLSPANSRVISKREDSGHSTPQEANPFSEGFPISFERHMSELNIKENSRWFFQR